ncbi:hypothetical protein [Lutibacter sp.]|uniref:hypothetical protein n=1 Tax=Lutibacter sp. TaxID=1925666 RepID=UPI0025C59496|nr:hypothetical protein [Lutibacter sp.]MCF6169283.1 hypothetical protein [Lutibacter sp.]
MNRILFIFIIVLNLILGCVPKKEKIESNITVNKEEYIKTEQFQNSFKIDTSLLKKTTFDFVKISNSKKNDSILSICNCKKDKKNNIIKIQLETAIPTQKELDTMSENFKKRNRILQTRDLGYLTKINGQFKFLTIILKDSLVKSIDLYSKSTEKEYNGIDFDSLSIEKYKISISKFDYSIASDVYGNFELQLKKGFGLFENDTILKGTFVCNNGEVSKKKEIKNWNIKKNFKNLIMNTELNLE